MSFERSADGFWMSSGIGWHIACEIIFSFFALLMISLSWLTLKSAMCCRRCFRICFSLLIILACHLGFFLGMVCAVILLRAWIQGCTPRVVNAMTPAAKTTTAPA
jgi:hypothetical protein